jgi:hypothetical protein
MRPLYEIELRELMPTSWTASSRGSRPSVLIAFFPAAHYCYSLALGEVTLHTLRMGRHQLDVLFLTQIHSALPFWKLLMSEFLLCISETLRCSAPAPYVKIVPLLYVHQLLMRIVGMLMYSQPGNFFCIIYYSMLKTYIIIIIINWMLSYHTNK